MAGQETSHKASESPSSFMKNTPNDKNITQTGYQNLFTGHDIGGKKNWECVVLFVLILKSFIIWVKLWHEVTQYSETAWQNKNNQAESSCAQLPPEKPHPANTTKADMAGLSISFSSSVLSLAEV